MLFFAVIYSKVCVLNFGCLSVTFLDYVLMLRLGECPRLRARVRVAMRQEK